MFLDFFAALQ